MRAKIVPLLPLGHTYVEPYGGAASIMCARRPAPVEVYNDLDGNLVNLFRVFQDKDAFAELRDRLRTTPYARDEFRLALDTLRRDDASNVERAWAFFVAQNQGVGGRRHNNESGWGYNVTASGRGMPRMCAGWNSRVVHLPAWRRRFIRVQIDSRCALKIIEVYDTPNTIFYLDPPYAPETRAAGSRDEYATEAPQEHHEALIKLLFKIEGATALSGYPTDLYSPLDAAGWDRREWQGVQTGAVRSKASGLQGKGALLAKAPRTEVLWRNPRCRDMLAAERKVPLNNR